MREQVLALLESRQASPAQAAVWLRIDQADLVGQLGQLGVE
jgi:hypothetical protein